MPTGTRVGIEAKIEYNPICDILGNRYESMRRFGLNDMQKGMSETEIEKIYQQKYNIQWAWADSIATEVKQTYNQLQTAKKLNIQRIKEQIKKKTKKASSTLNQLLKVKNPEQKHQNKLLGLKSKIIKIVAIKKELQKLETSERLHICFGSRKLFNAQYHLKENGYNSHGEWLADWQKKRGGRFYCIGKSTAGGGTMIKISYEGEDNFAATVTLPRFMQQENGKQIKIPFVVTEDRRGRKSSLLSALRGEKPITVQIFRREHKQDRWYIHLTTYVQEIPITTTPNNGCIGVDFNRDNVEWAYISSDGNLKDKGKIDYKWLGFSSGQRLVMMRNLVVKLSQLAFNYQCPIAIESLDFAKKKAAMSEASIAYNSMRSYSLQVCLERQ